MQDTYFIKREQFLNEISTYGVDPNSKFASFIYDKYQLNDITIKDLLEKYGKMYKQHLEEYGTDIDPVEELKAIPVDKYFGSDNWKDVVTRDDYDDYTDKDDERE